MRTGVKNLIQMMEGHALLEKEDSVRFTVTLTEKDMRRLEYLSKRFGLKRAEMSRDLFSAALTDAEEALGIETMIEVDGKNVLSDYGRYAILGEVTLDSLFAGQADEESEGDE